MKTAFLAAALLVIAPVWLHADTIAQWNFNGTNTPSIGAGTVLLLGGVSASYASGCNGDPDQSAANQGWNTASYPAQGVSNKTAGVQFNVSTLGYSDLQVRWDHRVSATASKYYRLQYSADGLNFLEAQTPVATTAISVFEPETNSLVAFAELNDNPNFAFRIVSEFESTALGVGAEGYVTTAGTNAYSRSGTVRFDLVTVSGTPIPGANTPPAISSFRDLTLRVNQSTGNLPLTIWDAQDRPEDLVVIASSSDTEVIAGSNLVLEGSGSNRTLRVTAGAQPGGAIISLDVVDTGGRSNRTSFVLTVLPLNTPPMISLVDPTNTVVNTATSPLPFLLADLESAADVLTVTGYSANAELVPNTSSNIILSGSGSNRSVALVPAPGQTGVAPIRLRVSDGVLTADSVFPLMVVPSASVVFYDPFGYADGSLLTNSAFLWENRSGTLGQCQVSHGQLQLTTTQTEDVSARLFGGPYIRSNGVVLYASFKVTFLSLPKAVPCYFAHFIGGSSLRGRIYAAATDALPGCYRLSVANGSDTNAPLFANLSTNATYTIVTRYHIDSASTTFWVNPAAESDPGVTAIDPQTAVSISAYGFRQDVDLGATLLVDDLRVGLSFAAVGAGPIRSPVPLLVERVEGGLLLRWGDPTFSLQAAPAAIGPFTNVPGASSPFPAANSGWARFFRLLAN